MPMNRGFHLRHYRSADDNQVRNLLKVLPILYPNGAKWLDRRLSDVLDGKAVCRVALWRRLVIALTIETPKGSGAVKLSTICVDERFRHLGIGRALLARSYRGWLHHDVCSAYVTADSSLLPALLPLLDCFGFQIIGLDRNRYAQGRDELVFCCRPQEIQRIDKLE
jgi:ribosomal protein S18 acetylase RimI-like enzyme